jgi:predicted small lipoprotein YifL
MRAALTLLGLAPVLSSLAACQVGGPQVYPVAEPPKTGGPTEHVEGCAVQAGINGEFDTEVFYDQGYAIVTVQPGRGVSSDQADKANACLAAQRRRI